MVIWAFKEFVSFTSVIKFFGIKVFIIFFYYPFNFRGFMVASFLVLKVQSQVVVKTMNFIESAISPPTNACFTASGWAVLVAKEACSAFSFFTLLALRPSPHPPLNK